MIDLPQRRVHLAKSIEASLGPFDPLLLQAICAIPRERFVRSDDIARSAEDVPLPLDDAGLATVSAPHAYLLSYRLLALSPRDRLVELGSGSGYGAALAAFVVGPAGHVTTIEIDPALASRTKEMLSGIPNIDAFHGDAVASTALWRSAPKIVCTFAVAEIPDAWLRAIPDGGALVAPVGAPTAQELVRAQRRGDALELTKHGGVRYVANRSPTVT